MFRLTADGKAYVCMQEGLIQGWKETTNIAELCSYKEEHDRAPSARAGLQWVGEAVPESVVGDALALIKHYNSFEIMIALFYNPDSSDWIARVPNQKGTGAHVAYDESEDLDVPGGYYFQGTIHSHPNMGAFWSGTDTNDQGGKAGVHLVIGTNSSGDMTSSKASLFYAGKQYDADYAFKFPDVVPEARPDWVSRIEDMRKRNTFVSKPTYTFTGGNWGAASTYRQRGAYPAGAMGFRDYWADMHTDHTAHAYPAGSCYQGYQDYRCYAAELATADSDDLSMLVPDMERMYCDNVFAFGLLKSLIDRFALCSPAQENTITDALDTAFAQAQIELEPSFSAEQAYKLARAISSVICPELSPDIAEVMDPERTGAENEAYYEVYQETVTNTEADDV